LKRSSSNRKRNELNILRKIKYGKEIRIIESGDLPAVLSLIWNHYEKQGRWMVTKKPEISGVYRKYFRIELMKRNKEMNKE
jgi:hypothetical protein